MQYNQIETFTISDFSYYEKIYINIGKSIGKIALIIIPLIDKCKYASMQCIIKHNNIYLDLDIVKKILELINTNNLSCLITLCKHSIPIYTRYTNIYDLIELCSGSVEISKHRYDSLLKCISYSDTIMIITRNNFIPKPIANIIPLAKAYNDRIFIFNL